MAEKFLPCVFCILHSAQACRQLLVEMGCTYRMCQYIGAVF